MHSTLDRADLPADEGRRQRAAAPPKAAHPDPTPTPAPDREDALRAALRGLEDALAQRRSTIDDFWASASPHGRSNGHHTRAASWRDADPVAPHGYGRPKAPRLHRLREGIGRRTERPIAHALAALRRLLAMVAGLCAVLSRPVRRALFGRSRSVAVPYPKRHPGSYDDRSPLDYLIPSIPLMASVGIIGLIIYSYPAFASTLFNRSRIASAPSLTGRRLAEAEQAAKDAGLMVEIARSEASENAPKDMVIDQDPRPGLRLEAGTPVRLVVSAGLRPPDVTGKTVEQARVDLIIRGWKPASEVETRVAGGAPNVVIDQRPGPREAVPEKGIVNLVVAAPNLALGRLTKNSAGAPAPEAVDGLASTVAWPAGPAPSWIEIELGVPSTVAALNLLPAMQQPGPAVVEIWGWDASGRFYPLQLVTQDLSDGRSVIARLTQPALNVVRLRIATTSSASPLGWREITVLDR